MGERSGLTIPEFAAAFPAEHAKWVASGGLFESADAVPGAESADDVLERIVPALREALSSVGPGETVCVVGHGASTKVALVALLGWDPVMGQSLRGMDNCGWATLVETGVGDALRLVVVQPGAHPISHLPEALAKIPRVVRRRVGRTPRWGCGAAGSASAWHAEGQGFESPHLHHHRRSEAVFSLEKTASGRVGAVCV